ncbi:hypothetical protein [Bacillus tianshenii]|nr:hypothetical protein [Bacillus tianshenii]
MEARNVSDARSFKKEAALPSDMMELMNKHTGMTMIVASAIK